MPLFEYRCDSHGKFEAYKRGAAEFAPCPSCHTESKKIFSVPRVERKYDRQVDGNLPAIGREQVKEREGGGKAVLVKETGNYRPAVTHNTVCPREQRWRNVSVDAKHPYGYRVTCEMCAYQWIYQATTAANPLLDGAKGEYRPPRRVFMNSDVPLHSGYDAPETA